MFQMKDQSSDSLSDYDEGLTLLFEQKLPHIDSSANLHEKYRPVAENREKYSLNNLDNSGLACVVQQLATVVTLDR